MRYFINTVVFISFCLLNVSLHANHPKQFKRFTTKDGLSSNTVLDIAQDHYGRIWFATYEGITCYDGFGFYTVKPRLIETNEILPAGETTKIQVDSLGNVWVLFDESGLIRIVGNRGECHRYEKSKGGINNNADIELNKDGVLILTTQNKSFTYDAKTDNFVDTGFQPKNYPKEETQKLRKYIEKKVPGVIIHAIYPNYSSTDYWVATLNKGIYRISKTNFSDFDHYSYDPSNNESLSSNEVYCLLIDKSGSVWVGTKDGGVSLSQNNNLPIHNLTHDADSRFIDSPIRAVYLDKDSALWIGTYNKGIVRKKGNNYQYFTFSHNLGGNYWDWIRSIFQTSDGFIWVGSYNGICRIHPKSYEQTFFKTDTIRGPLQTGRSYSMVEDSIGNLFIAEWGALSYFDKIRQEIYRIDTLSELRDKKIRKLHLDKKRHLWVGTESSGIFILDAVSKKCIKRFTNNLEADKINSNSVFEISEDRLGNIWIGSFGGLNKVDTQGKVVDLEWANKKLPSSIIYKIFFDSKGNIWCSTPKGLVRIDESHKTLRLFDHNDGLEVSEYLEGAGFMDKHGTIFLGGVEGLCYFKPEEMPVNKRCPENLLESVLLNGESQYIQSNTNSEIIYRYNHYENNLIFQLKSICVDSPNKSQIAWKLEPLDTDFTTNNKATAELIYKKLPPGDYRLIAKSANADGVWSEEKNMFSFSIRKPFWQQTYFLLAVLMSIIGFVYFIFKLRLSQIKRKNIQLESLVELRTQKIEKQKFELEQANSELETKNRKMIAQKDQILAQRDHLIEMHQKLEESNNLQQKFFMNISHDIRTPLSLIHGPLTEMLHRNDIPADIKPRVQMMQTQSGFLIQLLNQILDKKKLETGGMQLVYTHGDIVEVCSSIIDTFSVEAEKMNVQIAFIPSHKTYHLRFDFDKFRQIVFNLMANAVKFTPSQGAITCNLNIMPDGLEIKVTDTGIGIPSDRVKYIFNRYYQVGKSTASDNKGSGIGLSLVKDYTDLLQGNITVETQEGIGSCFTITLPIAEQTEIETTEPILSSETAAMVSTTATHEKKESILLVEDNNELRGYLTDILTKHFQVVAVENGKEAIDYLRKNQTISVILSDWMMPVMDGIELCKKIKKKDRYKTIPFILLTALSETSNQREAYKCGVDDFITKPFDPEILYLKIALLLKRNSEIKNAAIIEDKIEPENKTVTTFNNKLFDQIKQAVEKELSNPDFGQAELALNLGMSQMQLYRKLKELAKMSPNEFIRSIRIKRAKQLLKNEELIINEIGYMSGFNDPKYFSRCFSKETGMSPKKYRQTLTE